MEACQKSYDLNSNWDKWMAWLNTHPQSNFLFLKKSTESAHLFNVFVINAQEVAWTLQKHYSLFSRILKTEFDPMEATFDFENPHSPFWSGVFSNALLQGILFGYGERNSYFFSLEFENNPAEKKLSFCSMSSESLSGLKKHGDAIAIPLFRSYELPYEVDPLVLKYLAERKHIKAILRSKDFNKEVLSRIYGPCEPMKPLK